MCLRLQIRFDFLDAQRLWRCGLAASIGGVVVNKIDVATLKQQAAGRWPELLTNIGGLQSEIPPLR